MSDYRPGELYRRFTINKDNPKYQERDVKDKVTPDDLRKTALRRKIEEMEADRKLREDICYDQ